MRPSLATAWAAAVIGSTMLMSQTSPASAQMSAAGAGALALQSEPSLVQDVQYRDRYRYARPYAYERRYYDDRRYYRRRDRGSAVAAGVAGLAAGALIGGAIASQQAAPAYPVAPAADPDWLAYCSQRYRSFDPASGTYLGYDGQRHVCR